MSREEIMWHVDRRFCIVSDDGRGKYVIGSTLTDRPDPNDIKDVKYKSTGSMRNLLLLQADVRYECYSHPSREAVEVVLSLQFLPTGISPSPV